MNYSKKYIKTIFESNLYHNFARSFESILDLGNGVGLSSFALKQIFPRARLYATNVSGSGQWNFNHFMLKTPWGCENRFVLMEDHKKCPLVDMVFASEFFEHLERPIEYLKELIEDLKPPVFIIANAFNSCSIGHFQTYKNDNDVIDGKKVQRMFNKILKDYNYTQAKTQFWNNRPTVWIRSNG